MVFRADFWLRVPFLLLFLLSACAWNEPAVVDLPEEVEKVATPFVAALQKGDRKATENRVASGAQDELAAQFTKDHKQLKAAPKLTPRFITYKPEEMIGPDDSEVTIIYAAKSNGKWTTAEVRLFSLGDAPFQVDYWKIHDEAPAAKIYAPDLKPMAGVFAGLAAAIFVLGVLTIVIVLWLVRRKPHLIAPEPVVERRVAAVTRRDDETTE
jgi:hypothetical protein